MYWITIGVVRHMYDSRIRYCIAQTFVESGEGREKHRNRECRNFKRLFKWFCNDFYCLLLINVTKCSHDLG